jgi:hypothetical protein
VVVTSTGIARCYAAAGRTRGFGQLPYRFGDPGPQGIALVSLATFRPVRTTYLA